MNGMEILRQQMNLYHTMFVGCVILFLVFLLADIFLFWYLKIGSVYGYLTGKTKMKTMEKRKRDHKMMQSTETESVAVSGRTTSTNREEWCLTGRMECCQTEEIGKKQEERREKPIEKYGRFEITKTMIYIHTEEQIQ